MKIVTEHIFPPIPLRTHDWMAYVEGDEEGLTGRGPTEAEALRDLASQQADLMGGEYPTDDQIDAILAVVEEVEGIELSNTPSTWLKFAKGIRAVLAAGITA
jgi:hypothetical protein